MATLSIRYRKPYNSRHSYISWRLMVGHNRLLIAEEDGSVTTTLKALTAALGSRSMILSNVFAAPVGTRCSCSHLRSVEALTPNASANNRSRSRLSATDASMVS